jgi:hypothetical protein
MTAAHNGRPGRRGEDEAGRVGLAADAQRMHLERRLAARDRGQTSSM